MRLRFIHFYFKILRNIFWKLFYKQGALGFANKRFKNYNRDQYYNHCESVVSGPNLSLYLKVHFPLIIQRSCFISEAKYYQLYKHKTYVWN